MARTTSRTRRPEPPGKLTEDDIQKVIRTARAVAAEFRDEKDRVLEEYIEIFSPLVGRKVFGDKYFLAMAYLIAHKMKMAGLGDNQYGTIAESMRLASVSEGDSSISFNSAQSPTKDADAEYLLTSYDFDKETGQGTFPVLITDLMGGVIFQSDEMWVVNKANRTYGKAAQNIEWQLDGGAGKWVE